MVQGRRPATEHTMTTRDGVELFYRAWVPDGGAEKALVLFHRGHEHSGRWQQTVDALSLDDFAAFAWDARGHGRSPGERGDAESVSVLVRDAECFVRHIAEKHGIPCEKIVVVAQSVGAAIAAAWVHDYAPPIRGMVLAVPAFRVRLYIPFAIPLLRLRQKLLGPGYVKSYVKATMLTHDPEQARAYREDPLISAQIAVRILLGLHDISTRVVKDAGAITVPTLVLGAGSDWVVKLSTQERFVEGLSSSAKSIDVLRGFYHSVFSEAERRLAVERTRQFVESVFDSDPEVPDLLGADSSGYTHAEHDRLSRPCLLSPVFALQRLFIRTIGCLSDGVRLGCRAGFDSGVTLDYVYANKAHGITPLGKLIDHFYLESLGWRGIRQRKVHMGQMLADAIRRIDKAGRPVRLVDIASGPGRYILEAVVAARPIPVAAVLRDYKDENLEHGRALAERLGVKEARFVKGDAFDRGELASLDPQPTLAVVSGLYELFPANESVLNSLRGLADAMDPGGLLVYTGQPWHPQVEVIARTLTNREGQPWVMRRRTQAEMDALVREAGFRKIDMLIDEYGIFTVSLAELA